MLIICCCLLFIQKKNKGEQDYSHSPMRSDGYEDY
nr:MAG TPA: PROTEIN I, ELECTRON TRANSPORT [Crassvirales sp.]